MNYGQICNQIAYLPLLVYNKDMAYIPRLLIKEIKKSAREYPVVAILGPRQSGKTTVAQKTFPRRKYISMEDIDNRDFAYADPKGFLASYSSNVILDEVQRTPHLLSYIQTVVDKEKIKGQFILTGSNQFLLEEKLTQSLAGRVSILRLLPLSIKELQQQHDINLNTLLYTGLYPQLHIESIRPRQWFNNYIETYVNKDVRMIKNIGNLSQFNTFLKMLAGRVGQIINLQSLSNDCGISQNTVKSWISILESSFIIKRLPPYYKNFNKRLIKSSKIFFYDTGLLCRLLSIKKPEEIITYPLKGAIFENLIFTEIEKHFFNLGEKPPIYFWRDRKGHEIGFLIDGRTLKIIEVKAGQTLSQSFFKNIKDFKNIIDCKLLSYLIYSGENQQLRGETKVFSWKNIEKVFK